MDIKIKSKTWVGNIYHKFETVCQEVDDLVNQDTVRYVENRVQSVSEGVKKLYSGALRDLLPLPSVDSLSHKVQDSLEKQNDAIPSHTGSMIVTEEQSVGIVIKHSSVEQEPIDPLEKCQVSALTGLCNVKQCVPSPAEDLSTESDISSRQDGDSLTYENAGIVIEDYVSSDMGFDEKVMEERPQSESSFHSSAEVAVLLEALSFSECSVENHKDEVLNKDLLENPVYDANIRPFQKEKTLCDSFLNENYISNNFSSLQSSELTVSDTSCEHEITETALASSSSFPWRDPYNLLEPSNANIPEKAERLCYDSLSAICCDSDLSAALSSFESFPTFPCDKKDADIGLGMSSSIFSLESNDEYSSKFDEAISVAGSSGSKHEDCCKCAHLLALISSLEIGQADNSNIEIAVSGLETIDLSDETKLDESCVLVDCEQFYAAPCSARNYRSYKKLVQDAFASRKRLRKEYKQLAVWYADIELESSQQPEQNVLPSIATMSLESKTSQTQDLCDCDWELL